MKFTMVSAAEWHREFIADFAPERPALRRRSRVHRRERRRRWRAPSKAWKRKVPKVKGLMRRLWRCGGWARSVDAKSSSSGRQLGSFRHPRLALLP